MRCGDSQEDAPLEWRAPADRSADAVMHLAEKAGLWTDDRRTAARRVERRILAGELTVVRLSFADQHGILRGKTLTAGEIGSAMTGGVGFTTTMLLKDTAHRTVFPVWGAGGAFGSSEWEGAADVMMLPDPSTFRAAALGAAYRLDAVRHRLCRRPADAAQHAPDLSPGAVVARRRGATASSPASRSSSISSSWRRRASALGDSGPAGPTWGAARGLAAQPGLSVPDRAALRRAWIRSSRSCAPTSWASALPLRSLEVEFGPSQVEFTFRAGTGLEPADAMVLFRSAAKQVAQRNGYHLHLHVPAEAAQRHVERLASAPVAQGPSGANAFADPKEPLSPVGRPWMAGLLDRARGRRGFLNADDQRLQALPAFSARARQGDLGPRQSRRDGARAGRTGRSGEPPGEPGRRAGRKSLSRHGEPGRERTRWAEAPGRSRSIRRRALRGKAPPLPRSHEALAACAATRSSARASVISSSIIT